MIIAIPTPGQDLSARVDTRFGRAVGFVIYNTKDSSWHYMTNCLDELALEGAGVQASRNLLKKNIDILITGHCGPKAFKIFTEAGVSIYSNVSGSIKEALESLASGELTSLESADVEEHWS